MINDRMTPMREDALTKVIELMRAYGNDWRKVNEQRAAEMEEDERLGLVAPEAPDDAPPPR